MNQIQKAIGSMTLAALAGCSFTEAVVNVGNNYKRNPFGDDREVFIIQGMPLQQGFSYVQVQPASQPGVILVPYNVPQLMQQQAQPMQAKPDQSHEGIRFEDKERKYSIRADCE
ncbi:MAG TPA: hypothetical protein VJJ75_02210 [Candidatus Nanoarchaeia archaeon]|nr:hypothetical protein [Candidatus Nanoarchaeia archaeon]